MALSTEEQALFDHARNAVPRWLTTGKRALLEWLTGFVKVMDPVRALAQTYLDGIYFDTATGRWLDAHARDRDTTRREDELDPSLRERIRQVEDAVTSPALQRGINAIIGAEIVFPFDSDITIWDATNTAQRTIILPAGTYTAAEMEAFFAERLYPGWRFWFHNARAYFDSRDEAGIPQEFNLAWGDSEHQEALGFAFDAIDWVVATDGWYRSTIYPLPGFSAITNLRRQRAHMHIPGESTAFLSRGYRMSGMRPMVYLVSLPAGDASQKAAVSEYLRQYGPAGYKYVVNYFIP